MQFLEVGKLGKFPQCEILNQKWVLCVFIRLTNDQHQLSVNLEIRISNEALKNNVGKLTDYIVKRVKLYFYLLFYND